MATSEETRAGVVLAASHVTLAWEGEPIVANVDLALAPGELVCLVGRSGCGKTTLFHALAGLTTPQEGSVSLNGQDVTGKPGHVSYMLQKDLLLPQRTILDNVCLPLLIGGMPKAQARERVRRDLARFGLEGSEDLYPSQLSGGMRQRAALLRTYLMSNDVILLDEPFSALDALTRADMRTWFLGLVDELGLSALLVTHDVDEAVVLADRIIVLGGHVPSHAPSRIVGEVGVDQPRRSREGFELTQSYLDAKRAVFALLDQQA